MKIYLMLAMLAGSVALSQQDELAWSEVQNNKKIQYKSTFYSDGDFLYILVDGSRKDFIHKVDIETWTISKTIRTSLEWNNVTHKVLKTFTFSNQPHILSKTFDASKGITTTWIHSFDTENLAFSEPFKVADYNTPVVKTGAVDPDEEATRIFSNNLIGIYASLDGEHCLAISCKDLVGNVTEKNKNQQQNRTYIIHYFKGTLENMKTFEFIPPSNTFYIYQAAIDLGGMFYLMGRTWEIDFAKMRSANNQNIYGLNDLSVIKFNTVNGDYAKEKIETDGVYLRGVSMIVDNGAHFAGMWTSQNNKSHLFYSHYDSDLILQLNLDEELNSDLSSQVNYSFEVDLEKRQYKKEFDQEPAHIPLLNFETVLFEKLDNGHVIFGIEKQTQVYSATASSSYMPIRGSLILFCMYDGKIKWHTIIHKDQAFTEHQYYGVTAVNDGKQLHLIYNEGDFKIELTKPYLPANLIGSNTKPQRLKHLVIDENGTIETKTNAALVNENSLLNFDSWAREYKPGNYLILAKNKTRFSIGSFKY